MKQLFIFFGFFLFAFQVSSQSDDTPTKKGWKFGGAVPAIAYDSDVGFRYGGLANFYDYGDGSYYPNYLRSLYVEWSRTTKGSGNNIITYDDKAFFGSKIRLTADVRYLIEQALDFYGFNGFQADYNPDFSDEDSPNYLSRMYYRHDRRLLKIKTDFQGPIIDEKLLWMAGFSYNNVKIGSVDIDKLNKGKDEDEKLPDLEQQPGLYENYVNWGIISDDEKDGGNIGMFKVGLVYDTRDNEANPMNGLWTEALILAAPSFLGTASAYSQFVLTHRQYFTLIPNRLSLVYRLSYTQKLSGDIPFYMLPFYYNTKETRDAFGGSKTIRGVMRNRVVGDGVVFGNLEARWKFLITKIAKQDFYIALSGFTDAGRVTQRYDFEQNENTPNVWINQEAWHLGIGGGLRFALNENFIVAVDYGIALNQQDGTNGLYIALGWLF